MSFEGIGNRVSLRTARNAGRMQLTIYVHDAQRAILRGIFAAQCEVTREKIGEIGVLAPKKSPKSATPRPEVLQRRIRKLIRRATSLSEYIKEPVLIETRCTCDICGKVKPFRLYTDGRTKTFAIDACCKRT